LQRRVFGSLSRIRKPAKKRWEGRKIKGIRTGVAAQLLGGVMDSTKKEGGQEEGQGSSSERTLRKKKKPRKKEVPHLPQALLSWADT